MRHSKVHYLAKPTTVYRFISTSISNSNDWTKKAAFVENISLIRHYIISLYGKGQLSDFHVKWRENFLIGRLAWKYKKIGVALKILIFEQTKAVVNHLILRKKINETK
jgi:hypothetical protein